MERTHWYWYHCFYIHCRHGLLGHRGERRVCYIAVITIILFVVMSFVANQNTKKTKMNIVNMVGSLLFLILSRRSCRLYESHIFLLLTIVHGSRDSLQNGFVHGSFGSTILLHKSTFIMNHATVLSVSSLVAAPFSCTLFMLRSEKDHHTSNRHQQQRHEISR